MKKLLFCLLCSMLIGCSNSKNTADSLSLDYQDFEAQHIEWSTIFDIPQDAYLIYIYSPYCGHCKDIKDEVLSFANENKEVFYFVVYSNEITVLNNTEPIIGKSSYQDVGILGTPTLFFINNHVLVDVFTGSQEIIATLYNSY